MSFQETLQKLQEIDFESLELSDIDINNVGMWPLAGKMVVWVVLFLAIVLGLYQANIKGLLEEYSREEAKEMTLRAEFEQKVNDSANLEAYRVQMTEMEASFEALLKQLPQDTEVPGLLDDISTKGEDSGLVFSLIDLMPEKKEEFYIELPIQINANGGYHDFGSFVSGIASLPRIVTLGDFTVVPAGSRGTKDADGKKGDLKMTIIARTYRYRPKEDVAADAAKSKTKRSKGKKPAGGEK